MPYVAILYSYVALVGNTSMLTIIGVRLMPVNAKKLSANECDFLCNIGFRIQYMRKKARMSQAQLAERSGLADSTISHLESTSVYGLSIVAIYRIAGALGLEPDQLLKFD